MDFKNFPVQTVTYTYDQNGNRTSKQTLRSGEETLPQQTNYTYDFENRLLSLSYTHAPGLSGTQQDSFTYSGEGKRTKASRNNTITAYQYDGLDVLLERDAANTTTKTYTRALRFAGGIGGLIGQTLLNFYMRCRLPLIYSILMK